MRKRIILLFSLSILSFAISAEDLYSFKLTAAYTQNGLGYPFGNDVTHNTINPGFIIGTEFDYYNGKNFDLAETIFISASFHQNSFYGNVFSIGTEMIPRFHFKNGLCFDIIGGLAYTHIFSSIPVYGYEDGEYKQIIDFGRPNLTLNLGLGAGYDFSKKCSFPLKIFLRYGCDLIWNFSFDIYSLAFLPAQTISLGATYTFKGIK